MAVADTIRTFQLRGYTRKRGYEQLDYLLRQTRRLYNAAREQRIIAYFGYPGSPRHDPKSITFYDQCRDVAALRQSDPEWGDVHQQIARGALRRCDRAFQKFFEDRKAGRNTGYPKPKGNAQWQTLQVEDCSPAMVHVSHDGLRAKITIKGLPVIDARSSRPLPQSKPRAITLTRNGRRLAVNLTYEVETPAPAPPLIEAAGIDLGVTERIVASDGYVVAAADDRPHRRKLRVLQRRMARRRKGSGRRRKARAALARTHARHRTKRRNEAHRITTALIRRYGIIAFEALRVDAMARSAKGTVEQPGKNVRAKSSLNRSILEQRWGIIRDMLEYKGCAQGRTLVAVDPAYTSQACSRCGHIDAAARQGKRYACSACGLLIDADLNASRTILMRGLTTLGWPIDRQRDAQDCGIAATSGAIATLVPEIRTSMADQSPLADEYPPVCPPELAAAQSRTTTPTERRTYG